MLDKTSFIVVVTIIFGYISFICYRLATFIKDAKHDLALSDYRCNRLEEKVNILYDIIGDLSKLVREQRAELRAELLIYRKECMGVVDEAGR